MRAFRAVRHFLGWDPRIFKNYARGGSQAIYPNLHRWNRGPAAGRMIAVFRRPEKSARPLPDQL